MGNFFCQKLTMASTFNEKRTLKVSGISQFVRGQIEKEIQKKDNSTKYKDDVNRVCVCPEGKDYVLVEFSKDIPAGKKIGSTLKIVDTDLKVEKWNSRTVLNDDLVSKIWQANEVPITLPYNGETSSKSAGARGDECGNTSRVKKARQDSVDRRRGISSDQDARSETQSNDMEIKLNDDLMNEIEKDAKFKEMMDEQNVKLHQGYLSGPWSAISAVGRFIGSYISGSGETENSTDQRNGSSLFPSSAFDQPASSSKSVFDETARSKPPDEMFTVNSLFLRHILAYHYEVFEKLESVSKEISFEEKSRCEKDLKITARKNVDKKIFSKTVDEFIDFYQREHQKMHQEVVPLRLAQINMDVISETRSKFSVVIDSTAESNKLTIYGEKDKVSNAKSFLLSNVASSGTNSDSSKGTTGKGTTGKGTTGKEDLIEKLTCEVAKNVKLVVYRGDITKEEVDAIVNPANDRLQHGGGAALAILKAGGKSIQDDCDNIMKKRSYRSLKTGDVEITGGGKLPCKFIVHAVGPIWNSYSPNTSAQLLYNAVYNSLYWACFYGARSISIPAISSGLYKVPVDVCARVLFDAVIHFTNAVDKSVPLKEIHFVNIDHPTNRTFSQEMQKRFAGSLKRERVEAHLPKNDKGLDQAMQNRQSQTAFWVSNPGSSQRPGSGQPMKATYQGSHTHGSGVDTSKGKNPTSSQPPKPLLSYSEAAGGKKSGTPGDPKPGADDGASNDDECCICLSGFVNKKTLDKCGHSFCRKCIDDAFKVKKQCPMCFTVYGPLTGDQPVGRMYDSFQSTNVPGFGSCGTIVISYRFPTGTQGPNHPNPGKPYQGTNRTAYLPNNDEGKKVLKLLKKAFDQKLTFTIGRSTTSGRDDVITWNDIHHKTSIYGGTSGYGYPDPNYLKRVQDELAAKGITE